MNESVILKLALSVAVGGLIGVEREYRSKSAGFRTLMLICLGACMFTIFSELIGAKGAPERIASNIVVGIGFVGAGVIFRGDNRVNGITTAASIWITAALGMGIGAGYELISLWGCGFALCVLFLFTRLELWIDRINQIRNYKIVCDFQSRSLKRFEILFRQFGLSFKRVRETKSGDNISGEWVVKGSQKNHDLFIEAMIADPAVRDFEC